MSYGRRYIEHNHLARYFRKVAPNKGEASQESSYTEEIEFFDTEDRFKPVVRVVLPPDYVATVALLKWKRMNGEDIDGEIKRFPSLWTSIEDFFGIVGEWNWPRSELENHPFDCPPLSLREYFLSDANVGNKPWQEYDVDYERDNDIGKANRATHYFHYYHIHLLDALRREYVVNVVPRASWNKKLPITWKDTFRATHNFGYLINSHNLQRIEPQYKILAMFVELSARRLNVLSGKITDNTTDTESHAIYGAFDEYQATLAKRIVADSGESFELMESFLNTMCKLYIAYEEHGRSGLMGELRHDIDQLVNLIVLGFDTDEKTLFKRSPAPPYGGWRKSLLDWVFPNHVDIVRMSVERSIRGTLKHIQKWERQPEELQEPDCHEITNKLAIGPHVGVLIAINEINEAWNSRSPFSKSIIVSQFRSLLVSIEDLVRDVSNHFRRKQEKEAETREYERVYFSDTIRQVFEGANWIGPFKSCYDALNKKEFVDATSILNAVDEIVDKIKLAEKASLRNLLITILLRNHFSHNSEDLNIKRPDLARCIESAKTTLLLVCASESAKNALTQPNKIRE